MSYAPRSTQATYNVSDLSQHPPHGVNLHKGGMSPNRMGEKSSTPQFFFTKQNSETLQVENELRYN